ncbi:MAG: hypothetical protein AABW68_02290 [archaeon]
MSKRLLPSLPVKFLLDEANALILDELDAANWGEIDVPKPLLELVPYYVFQYDSYSEVEEEGTKIRNVDVSVQGVSSVNAVSNALDDVVAELCPPELIRGEFTDPKDVSVNVKEPRFSLEEAKSSSQIKIAAHEKVPRSNVHILGMRLVYIPFWEYGIELEVDNRIRIRVNAVTGEFEGEESGIPYQGKTKTELVKETLSDLQHPSGWADYIVHFGRDLVSLFRLDKEHPNRGVMVVILLIIAFFLLVLGFVKFP